MIFARSSCDYLFPHSSSCVFFSVNYSKAERKSPTLLTLRNERALLHSFDLTKAFDLFERSHPSSSSSSCFCLKHELALQLAPLHPPPPPPSPGPSIQVACLPLQLQCPIDWRKQECFNELRIAFGAVFHTDSKRVALDKHRATIR